LLLALWTRPGGAEHRVSTAAEVALAPVLPDVAQQTATLRERLIYGLLAKIPAEIEFIDRVVELVDKGKLPVRLVNETFFWARERASAPRDGSPQRPIIYFQPAMRARAERIGIDL
jgi:hypothetical protein